MYRKPCVGKREDILPLHLPHSALWQSHRLSLSSAQLNFVFLSFGSSTYLMSACALILCLVTLLTMTARLYRFGTHRIHWQKHGKVHRLFAVPAFYYNSGGELCPEYQGCWRFVLYCRQNQNRQNSKSHLRLFITFIISFYFCNFHNYFKATVLVTISPLSVMSIMP